MGQRYGLQNRGQQPSAMEMTELLNWLVENGIASREYDPLSIDNPNQDYDYLSAFRSGENRGSQSRHFTDRFKLPNHPTFSTESIYYNEGMPAVEWLNDEEFLPAGVLGRKIY